MIDLHLMSDETLAQVLGQRLKLETSQEIVGQDETSARTCITIALKCGPHTITSTDLYINEAL